MRHARSLVLLVLLWHCIKAMPSGDESCSALASARPGTASKTHYANTMFLLVSCTEKRRVKVATGARSRCVNNDSSVIKLSAKCNDPRRKNSLTGVVLSARVPQDRDRDV